MLTAESIQKNYPTRSGFLTVLTDITLKLQPGESAAVMGPSGSGKSTLLNILGTLEPPSGGRVSVDGCDPLSLSEPELARFRNRHIGFVFQDHHLLAQCSLLENVLLATLPQRDGGDQVERARRLLERVGLGKRLDHRPAELSGGEKQRAALARALINHPSLVLADEPTGNLDSASADNVADLLAELHHDTRSVLVVVTHSEALAARFQKRFNLSSGTLTPR